MTMVHVAAYDLRSKGITPEMEARFDQGVCIWSWDRITNKELDRDITLKGFKTLALLQGFEVTECEEKVSE